VCKAASWTVPSLLGIIGIAAVMLGVLSMGLWRSSRPPEQKRWNQQNDYTTNRAFG